MALERVMAVSGESLALGSAQDDVPAPLGVANAALLSLSTVLFLALSAAAGLELWRRRALGTGTDASLTTKEATAVASTGTTRSGQTQRHTPAAASASASVPASGSSAANSPLQPADSADDGASLSIGVEMRRRLFQLMLAAAALRACSLVVELATVSAVVALPPSAAFRRLLAAFLWLPSMLFVSLFGVVLLFWVQLCYACGGTASPWPRRLFFAVNMLLYAGFAALVALARTTGDIWQGCDLAQSLLYLAGLLGIAHYGMQLVRYFRLQSADDDFIGDYPPSGRAGRSWVITRRQVALRRITAVCILLCLLFASKAAYLVVLGTGYLKSEQEQYRTPVGISHVASEFVVHFATELVPCAMLLVFMRKSSGRQPEQAPRSDRTSSMSSVGTNSLPRDGTGEFLSVRSNPSGGGGIRNFGGFNANAGVVAGRQQQQPEEAMAMLNPYHQQQQIRPGYGSVNTSGGAIGRLNPRGDGYQHQPYNTADGTFSARGAKMNGGAAAGRRDYASEYRRHNM